MNRDRQSPAPAPSESAFDATPIVPSRGLAEGGLTIIGYTTGAEHHPDGTNIIPAYSNPC